MGCNQNGMESEWAGIGMENGNRNKLFTLVVGIIIGMNCIVIDVFTLSWNLNELLQVTKLTLVHYFHYFLLLLCYC